MKRENLMNEIEKCIEDSNDRKKIMEGLFGYILTCTQVIYDLHYHLQLRQGLISCCFNYSGSSSGSTLCCFSRKARSWFLGIC